MKPQDYRRAIARLPKHIEVIQQIKKNIWDSETNNIYLDYIANDLKIITQYFESDQFRWQGK